MSEISADLRVGLAQIHASIDIVRNSHRNENLDTAKIYLEQVQGSYRIVLRLAKEKLPQI